MSKTIKFSSRETDVLSLLYKGYSNRKISTKLGINEKTVSSYISRVKLKLALEKDKDNMFAVVSGWLKTKYSSVDA